MICKNCGAKIDNGDVFCGQCGESIADAHDTVQNAAMDKQQIIKYLEIGVDLEKQKYLQKRTLERLDRQINSLGVAKSFIIPEKRENNYNPYPRFIVSGLFIGAFIGYILYLAGLYTFSVFGLYSISLTLEKSFYYGGTIGSLLGLICALILDFSKKSVIKNEYREQVEIYNCNIAQDQQRVSNECVQKKMLIADRKTLFMQHQMTKNSLIKYYAKGIIYENYRYDFTAIASFLDYFKSGRCSTLGEKNGGDGAYNEYAKDVRCQLIRASISEVLKSLEQIKSNQWSIYSAIKEGNSISEKLLEKTKRIVTDVSRIASATEQTAANTAIGAYAAQEAAKELRYLNWIETNNYFNR